MKFSDIDWSEWEECSVDEFNITKVNEGIILMIPNEGKFKEIYFRKKQKFPIKFKLSCNRVIEVNEKGDIFFIFEENLSSFSINESWDGIKELEILEKAVEKSKELRNDN